MPDTAKSIDERLNPQITDFDVGVRSLRKVRIYPLSMANQLELSDLITEALSVFLQTQGDKADELSMEFVGFMVELIKKNIERIIGYILADEVPTQVMKDITNEQLSGMVEIVYRQNFEGPLKKVVSLFQTSEEAIQLRSVDLSQPFAESTGTGSKTSTKKLSKKAD